MQNKNDDDDQRTVIVTVSKLKMFEAAVRVRAGAVLRKERAGDAADAARLVFERATLDEAAAHDAEIAATRALHEADPK